MEVVMMRMRCAAWALLFLVAVVPAQATWIEPFISEIHYDNVGADRDEFVAVSVPGGIDLAGWQLVLYNGFNGMSYYSEALSGTGSGAGLSEFHWFIQRIQNGPDAVALISSFGDVVDFVAYEQIVTALNGPAVGSTARLLPVAQASDSPVGWSLQRGGDSSNWFWALAEATPGRVNTVLAARSTNDVPEAPVVALWLTGLVAWLLITFWPRSGFDYVNAGRRVDSNVEPTLGRASGRCGTQFVYAGEEWHEAKPRFFVLSRAKR